MNDENNTTSADRYVSFKDIDVAGNSARLLQRIYAIINDPDKTNAFWERFKERMRAAGDAENRVTDELCLLCSHTYFIEELFDDYADEEGLRYLKRLEEECC